MNRYDTTLPLYGNAGPKKRPTIGLGLRDQFQISGYMMLASLVFWLFLIYSGIRGIQYALMYRGFDDANLDNPNCCTNFGGTMQDNLNFIEGYKKGDAGPYLSRLGPETYSNPFKGTQSPIELEEIPPIVTAVTSDDFYDLQGLLKQIDEEIRPAFPNVKFVVYDIGLYTSELDILKTHAKCDVRSFRASSYPDHVADTSTFAWRPIIIQSMIEEFGSVFYVSPNSRFTKAGDLRQLRHRGERYFFIWEPPEFISTVAYTNPETFRYLREMPCCYKESGLVDMSAMVLYRTNATWNAIMKPWLKCALNKECISPPKSRYSGCFHMRKPKTTGCHRYDQSVLSIIMERVFLFTFNAEKYVIPRITRETYEYVYYFPEQPWTYLEMFLVSAVPLSCVGGLFYIYRRQRWRKPTHRKN